MRMTSMNCEEAVEFITMAVDGELEDARQERLTEHLTSCSLCQNRQTYEKRFKALLSERVRQVHAPAGLKQRILSHLRVLPVPISRWQRIGLLVERHPRSLVSAMAAMLIVSFVAGIWGGRETSQPPLVIMEMVTHHENCKVEISTGIPGEVMNWFTAHGVSVAFNTPAWADSIPVVLLDTPRMNALDYKLIGAHLCQLFHQNAAYVVYDKDGLDVSLCFIENATIDLEQLNRVDYNRTPFYTVNYQGDNLVLWKDGTRIFAMMGHVPQGDLLSIAAEKRNL